MWKQPKIIALLLLFVTVLLQAAAAHSLVHDEEDTHCETCILVQQHSGQALVFDLDQARFDFLQHSVYVEKEILGYSAFAKASIPQSSLSIRPPPYS